MEIVVLRTTVKYCVGCLLAGSVILGAGGVGGCAKPSSVATEPAVPDRRPDLTSNLRIPAGQTFLLGGGQPEGFLADAVNEGETSVSIFAEENGNRLLVAKLEPGQAATHWFIPGQCAQLVNESAEDAGQLKVRVWGNVKLGMRYETWAE